MVSAWSEIEKMREREDWRRVAFLAAQTINVAGKVSKRTVKPEDLIRFDDGRAKMTPDERDKRRREAAETLLLHQSKFWTKFKPDNVAKITGERTDG